MKANKLGGLASIRCAGTATAIVVSALSFSAKPAWAIAGFEGVDTLLNEIPKQGLDLYLHPFTGVDASVKSSPGMKLFETGAIDLDTLARTAVKGAGVNPSLSMKQVAASQAFGLTDPGSRQHYYFYVGGYRICGGYDLVAHRLSNGDPAIFGLVPQFGEANVPDANDWPDQQAAVENVKNDIGHQFDIDISSSVLKRTERCFVVEDSRLVPAWEIDVAVNDLLHRGIADDSRMLKTSEQRFFSADTFNATGQAQVYIDNPRTGALETVSLTGLKDGTNELSTEKFDTYPVGQTKASESSRNYKYSVSRVQFDEVSTFTHAVRQMAFFEGLGYKFSGDKVLIVSHAQPGGTPNNALYQPKESSSYGQPTIQIGDGDGSILQNLPIDADVVGHELGHHVVFETLKAISGQSLTLHEALADFFAFARQGNACLAESICPDGAPDYANRGACWTAKTCLRSGETSLKATDKTIPGTSISLKDGHIRGQAVTGMLWDLRKNNKVESNDLTKIVFKAVSYLKESSGFRDFQLALFLADQELYNKKYAQALYDAASDRGFTSYISDVKVGSAYPSVGSLGGSESLGNVDGSSDDSSKKKFLGITCGVTGAKGTAWSLAWLALLPLVFALRIQPPRQKAGVKKRRSKL